MMNNIPIRQQQAITLRTSPLRRSAQALWAAVALTMLFAATLPQAVAATPKQEGGAEVVTPIRQYGFGSAETGSNDNTALLSDSRLQVSQSSADPAGSWSVAASDSEQWQADLALTVSGEEPDGTVLLAGRFLWNSTDFTYGREIVEGSFDPDTSAVTLGGTALENASGISLNNYTATLSADGSRLLNGTWGNDGTFTATRVSAVESTFDSDLEGWTRNASAATPTPTPTPTPGPGGDEITIMLPGDVPLELVRIPAGTFVMGSPEDERSRDEDEGPLTTVTLTEDFYMGKYEVTVGQFLAYLNATGDETGVDFNDNHCPVERDGSRGYRLTGDSDGFGQSLSQPMVEVSSNGAVAFTEWVGQLSGRTVGLPTEAQWEYACRAGTTTRFSFGDSLGPNDECETDNERDEYMVFCGNRPEINGNGHTAEVGTKLPNPWGLYDMHGNVWEWCADWYEDSLPGGSVTDPTGPDSASDRVIRSGVIGRECRSANRRNLNSSIAATNTGFRVASVR